MNEIANHLAFTAETSLNSLYLYNIYKTDQNTDNSIFFLMCNHNRSGRTSGFFRSKGRVTIAWPMKTFISRCYVRNASSGVVVPYTVICVLSIYYSFIVHLRGTIICFRIAVVKYVAGDALALSCGADWLWTLCRLRVVAWTRHLGYNTLYHSGRLAYLFSSLEGPMNHC